MATEDNRLLYISRIGCPPPYMGNRARVKSLIQEIRSLGYKVHFAGAGGSSEGRESTEAYVDEWVWDFLPYYKSNGIVDRIVSAATWRAQRLLSLPGSRRIVDKTFHPSWYRQAVAIQQQRKYRRVLVSYVHHSKFLTAFPEADIRIVDTHDVFSDRHERLHAAGVDDFPPTLTPKQEAFGLRRANCIIA